MERPPLRLRSAPVRAALASLPLALSVAFVSASFADSLIELSGGALVPFDGDHRDTYGTSGIGTVGLSSLIGENRGRVFLEIGYSEISGFEIDPDPTFEMEKSTIRWIPLSVGLRTRLDDSHSDRGARISVGAGWQMVFARWQGPGSESESTPTFGGFVELRPEFRVDSRWMVWVRQRLTFLADAGFDATLANEVNYSGNTLEVGVAIDLGSSSPERPRSPRMEP